ncbi:hypothetical protein B0H13DRAFT_2350950 [Mycena leptocephala]|nr:hypothetical protein B0H13DRAFT_2350950 [Mycena leptocephala]
MSPPKPTHPLAHLPDPPQNYIPCAPTKYWPSTMDEEQHSSQGNKWWWLVYLGPMQGAYATRATAVANVPSASKIENAIEYFDTLTDLNHGWKKSCFHSGKAIVRCTSRVPPARNFVRAAQRTATRVLNDSAAALAAFRVLGLLRTFLEAEAKVEEYLVDPHRQIHLHVSIHHRHSHSAFLRGVPYPSTLTARPQDPPPPLPLLLLIPTLLLGVLNEHGGKKPPDCSVKTEHKPYAKTEPEPRIKLKSGIKQEVKLKPNLQHDVERSCSRSHVPVPLHDPDSESDEQIQGDAAETEAASEEQVRVDKTATHRPWGSLRTAVVE